MKRKLTVQETLGAFGARVKDARRYAGLTQEELAEKLELTANFVAHLERGSRAPSIETLCGLSDVLQKRVPWFFEDMIKVMAVTKETAEERRLLVAFSQLPAGARRALVQMVTRHPKKKSDR